MGQNLLVDEDTTAKCFRSCVQLIARGSVGRKKQWVRKRPLQHGVLALQSKVLNVTYYTLMSFINKCPVTEIYVDIYKLPADFFF